MQHYKKRFTTPEAESSNGFTKAMLSKQGGKFQTGGDCSNLPTYTYKGIQKEAKQATYQKKQDAEFKWGVDDTARAIALASDIANLCTKNPTASAALGAISVLGDATGEITDAIQGEQRGITAARNIGASALMHTAGIFLRGAQKKAITQGFKKQLNFLQKALSVIGTGTLGVSATALYKPGKEVITKISNGDELSEQDFKTIYQILSVVTQGAQQVVKRTQVKTVDANAGKSTQFRLKATGSDGKDHTLIMDKTKAESYIEKAKVDGIDAANQKLWEENPELEF